MFTEKRTPKRIRKTPPPCALALLPAGEPFDLKIFEREECLPRKREGRAAYRIGIERLFLAPVAFHSVQPLVSGKDWHEFLFLASAASFAARLPLNELRTLACAIGRNPSFDSDMGGMTHRRIKPRRFSSYNLNPGDSFIGDVFTTVSGVDQKDQHFGLLSRISDKQGLSGWASNLTHGAAIGESVWPMGVAAKVAQALAAKQWGPVMAREVQSSHSVRGFSPDSAARAALREEFASWARSFLEAQALTAELKNAKMEHLNKNGVEKPSTLRSPTRL